MSVSFVGTEHINAILSYAHAHQPKNYPPDELDGLGKSLLRANLESFVSFYGESEQQHLDLLQEIQDFNFLCDDHYLSLPSLHLQTIKLILCLEYQCDYKPLWTSSSQKAFCDSLLHSAISQADSYSQLIWHYE